MKKKNWYFVLGIFVFLVLLIVLPSFSNNDKSKIIEQEKKDLGFYYQITLNRTQKMTRPGRNFNAVIVPESTKPTVDQLRKLGELLRDENADQPFLWISIYNDAEASKKEISSYNLNDDKQYKIVEGFQNHMIAQYNKNNATGLNQYEIYPTGFDVDKMDAITINY